MEIQDLRWRADPGDYDFDAFDRLFMEKQRQEANAIEEQVEKSDNYLLRLFPPKPEINLFQRRYLGPLTYEPGITIVKSPKGSGRSGPMLRRNKHHIAKAKSVIVLDADMSLITTQVLKILRLTDWDQQCRIIYNKPLPVEGHREVLMFKTEGQLIHDLMRSLRAGQRCFVASNSRKRVQELSVMIRGEFGETRRRLVMTSEESQTPKIRDFLSDVRTQILEYDLIVSPAMGTGVDISFENDECRIDCVYGFFEPFINTHADIDQQLARVRNPGSVNVWFKPGRFDFETSIDTIRDDLARAGVATKAVEWLGNGKLKYDKDDPLLEIWTHVTCARRSSMKNIERLFIGLREANGWSVVKAEHDDASAQSGKAALKDAEQIRNAEHVERVMKAPLIDRQGFLDIKTCKNKGQLTLLERAAPEKYELERAFGLSLTEDIVRRNLMGGCANGSRCLRILDPSECFV